MLLSSSRWWNRAVRAGELRVGTVSARRIPAIHTDGIATTVAHRGSGQRVVPGQTGASGQP